MMSETEPAANGPELETELELTHVDEIYAAVQRLEAGDTLTYRLPGDDRVENLTVDAVETGDDWTGDDHSRVVYLNGPRGGSYSLRDRYPVETTNGSHVHRLTITSRASGTVAELADELDHGEDTTLTGRNIRILTNVPEDVAGFHSDAWNYGYFGDSEDVTLFIADDAADIHIWTDEREDAGGVVRVSAPKDAGEDIKALDWNRVEYAPEYADDDFYWKVSSRAIAYMIEELNAAGYTVTLGQNAARKAGDYRNQGRYDIPGVDDDGRFMTSEYPTDGGE